MMNELRMLEERHMISILLYIAKNEGCMKTDIYREVSHAQGMPGKLDTLAEGGLIRAEGVDDRMMRRFYLTDSGRRTVDALIEVGKAMNVESELSQTIFGPSWKGRP